MSEITGKSYEAEDVIWYGNALQAAQYYRWGARPVDFDVSEETGKWIFAISIEDHKKYIGRWNEQKRENREGVKYSRENEIQCR